MPEFILNDKDTREFTQLPKITQGYIEAMFFTECGGSLAEGDFDPENGSQLPEEASWLEIGDDDLKHLVLSTVKWRDANQAMLERAYEAKGNESDYDEVRAGNDLWYTSQGHGVGFWDRGFPKDISDALSDAARAYGEDYVSWETTNEEECAGVVYIG